MKQRRIKLSTTNILSNININSPSLLKPQSTSFNSTKKILSQLDDKIVFKDIKNAKKNKVFNETLKIEKKTPITEKTKNIVFLF